MIAHVHVGLNMHLHVKCPVPIERVITAVMNNWSHRTGISTKGKSLFFTSIKKQKGSLTAGKNSRLCGQLYIDNIYVVLILVSERLVSIGAPNWIL